MTQYLFYIFSSISIFAALMVLISKKPIHSVLYLVLAFFSISGHFILLNAQFIAIVNIIVYAGAIMVLFLFTVMLLNLNISTELTKPRIIKVIAGISAAMILITIVGALKGISLAPPDSAGITQIGLVKNLGKVLFSDFILPFEVSAVLFLSAMIGAVMLGKKTADE